MNKKFLSAILFGALMVTSTGTFVSCKDYDDEIDELNTRVDGIEGQLRELKSAVDNGKWITGVESTTTGFTITMNDGKTYSVTNGKDGEKGEKGEAGNKVTIDSKTGKITIDGTETEFFAVKNTETGKLAVPEIGEDGFWYIVNKEGKLEATSYKASPVSMVENPNTKEWILKVWNTETKKYDEVTLPTAASLITDFEIMGLWDGEKIVSGITNETESTTPAAAAEESGVNLMSTELSVYKYPVTEETAKNWKGPKPVEKDAYLISSPDNMLVRIAPSSLNAAGTEFNIVNSKNHSPLGISLSPAVKFDKVLSRAAGDAGLYTVGVKTVMFKPAANADMSKLDETDVTKTVFALQDISGGFTSHFTLGIKNGEAVSVENIKVNDTKVGAENTKQSAKYQTVIIDLNKDNTISFEKPSGVYDSYITYSDADKKLFGLTHDNGKMTFKASSMPDIVTKATFDITIHYLTVGGNIKERTVEVKVNSSLTETVYDKTHKLIADEKSENPNYFAVNLQSMKENMGETNYAIFTKNVNLSKTTYTYSHVNTDGKTVNDVEYDANDETGKPGTAKAKGITEYIVKEDKAKNEENVTAVADANFIKFAISNATAANNFNLNTKYTTTVTFRDGNGEALATIKVNFTLTVPALKDLLTIEEAVYNKEAGSLFAYMTEGEDIKDSELKAPKYTFKNGFTSTYAKTVKDNSIEFAVYDKAEYAKGKNVSDVAEVTVPKDKDKKEQYAEQYIVLRKDKDGAYPVYSKDIKVNIKSASYLGVWDYDINEKNGDWYAFNIRLMSPITCDQASIAPADNVSIKIPATTTENMKVVEKDFKALTYNKQPFGIFANKIVGKDKEATTTWNNAYVKDVRFKSTNTNVFGVEGTSIENSEYVHAYAATLNDKGTAVAAESHVLVAPGQIENESTKDMEVVLTDIWGFTKKANIPVTVQRDK